jgi:uncharacterized phage-associated protein
MARVAPVRPRIRSVASLHWIGDVWLEPAPRFADENPMSLHREKLKDVIVYVASHAGVSDLGLTKLYKLVYFADAAHLREHGSTITGSDYIKYEHGPVPSRGEKSVKQLRKEERIHTAKVPFAGYEMISIAAIGAPSWSALDDDEVATLDAVCSELGRETAKELSKRSHAEPAWASAQLLEKLSPELMMYGVAEDPDGL